MGIHELYAELAVSLLRATTNPFETGAPQAVKGTILDNCGSQSTFENACRRLVEFGVAYYDYSRNGYEALAIDGENVKQFVIDRSRAGHFQLPNIDEVVSDWIWCVDFFGFASPKRVPFAPNGPIDDVIRELVALGYAKRLDAAVIWTDKIGPAMRIAGVWDENNVSFEEING